MDSELMIEIMNARIQQLREENGGENEPFELETDKINTDLDILYYHLTSINPKLKYHWMCTGCIKRHGVNCNPIIQTNNKQKMKKLMKHHNNSLT